MISKIIESIKAEIPEILHFAVFYNNGTVFHTDFHEPANVPEIGAQLSYIINHGQRLVDQSGFKAKNYRRMIYETAEFMIIVLPLGEDSHMALFLDSPPAEIRIQPIQKYLEIIQDIVDVSTAELQQKEDEEKAKELEEDELKE